MRTFGRINDNRAESSHRAGGAGRRDNEENARKGTRENEHDIFYCPVLLKYSGFLVI